MDIVYVCVAYVKVLSGNEAENGNQSDSEGEFVTYTKCHVQLKLMLEMWNIDDRILLDKDHKKRPYLKKLILREQ